MEENSSFHNKASKEEGISRHLALTEELSTSWKMPNKWLKCY